MNKSLILQEIKRIAKKNEGNPPGKEKFSKETGIKESSWYGVFWARWGDALLEAGFEPNKFNKAYDHDFLLHHLAELTLRLGRFPVSGDIRLEGKKNKDFPSHNTFQNLGKKDEKVQKLFEYSSSIARFESVEKICNELLSKNQTVKKITVKSPKIEFEESYGYVYLMKSGRFYKIGRTNSVGRRQYELSIQLPERVELVHEISTDDPAGIEAYWHNRFREKRKNGEWFELSSSDVKAFKKRRFM